MPKAAPTAIARWTEIAKGLLLGRTITGVRYMSSAEANDLGWGRHAVVLILDNGLQIYPSADDEGNDAGALFTTDAEHSALPVL